MVIIWEFCGESPCRVVLCHCRGRNILKRTHTYTQGHTHSRAHTHTHAHMCTHARTHTHSHVWITPSHDSVTPLPFSFPVPLLSRAGLQPSVAPPRLEHQEFSIPPSPPAGHSQNKHSTGRIKRTSDLLPWVNLVTENSKSSPVWLPSIFSILLFRVCPKGIQVTFCCHPGCVGRPHKSCLTGRTPLTLPPLHA